MSSRVYFIPVSPHAPADEIRKKSRLLLEKILKEEQVALEPEIAVKTHFGEWGNRTFIPAEDYDGILDLLQERNVKAEFIETCVLYGGKRYTAVAHKKLGIDHGFTRLPIEIADGEKGEEYTSVPVKGKHFNQCFLGKGFDKFSQLLVLAHFKGHSLAGFGGALKQLSMGFAAKGGKLAMHMGIKPKIWNLFCKHCGLCAKRCQVGAIHVAKGEKSYIDHSLCLGCGACFSACPHHAVSILSLSGLKNMLFQKKIFRERIVEYACASHTGRRNIYMNFAINITKGCDCEPRPMFNAIDDIGIFVSMDPVAIDSACWDACAKAGKSFKGEQQLDYAEALGMGTKKYALISVPGEIKA